MKDFCEINDLVESVECRMQDAYEQGYETGHKDGEARGIDKMNNLSKEAYVKGLEDTWECARKIVLSPIDGGLTVKVFKEIFGEPTYQSVLRKYTAFEVMQKIKEYEEQQKIAEYEYKQKKERCKTCEYYEGYSCYDCIKGIKDCFEPKQTDATDMNDGNIKVGDEVSCPQIDSRGIVIQTANKNTLLVLTNSMDGLLRTDESKVARTGRKFPQIAEVLEQLRGEEE